MAQYAYFSTTKTVCDECGIPTEWWKPVLIKNEFKKVCEQCIKGLNDRKL